MDNEQNQLAGTVMIVDDELFFRGLLRDILTKAGLNVVAEAANGTDAVVMYREYSPDIVLMDIYMPEKSGIDSTGEIMAIDPGAKILICSGVGYDQDLDAAMQAGARGVVYKPFYDEEVLEMVRKTLAE
ncbi:MAG TPA: response regulator [Geobacteraceae bacterium]|nr:response regulator [Geobacteraceae bacterium]